MAISTDRVRELAEKHGRVEHVKEKHGLAECVLRMPTRAEYKAFRAGAQAQNPDAQENLVRQIMVEPESGAEKDALFDKWVACAEACSAAIYRLTGIAAEELAK
jgi:hypothetical protein